MCLVLMLKARPLHTMPYTERPLDVYREMSSLSGQRELVEREGDRGKAGMLMKK